MFTSFCVTLVHCSFAGEIPVVFCPFPLVALFHHYIHTSHYPCPSLVSYIQCWIGSLPSTPPPPSHMLGSSVWACHFVCLEPLFRLIRCLPLFVIYMPDLAPPYLLFCSWGSMLQVIQWLFFGLSSVLSCSIGCFSATTILDVQVSLPLAPPVNHQHSRATSFIYYGLCFCHHCSNYHCFFVLVLVCPFLQGLCICISGRIRSLFFPHWVF